MARFLLLLASAWLSTFCAVFAQATIYQPFEVDSGAVPRGGMSVLEAFLAVNVQKPVMAQVANAQGRVVIQAVVEPDGHLSNVTVLRGLRPDCDREALRVMRLFNAWKPALKERKIVRQAVTYPIVFRANPPVDYQQGRQLSYYDANLRPASDIQTASYVFIMPVDTLTNLPTGELRFCESARGKTGKELNRFPLVKVKQNAVNPTDPPTYWLGHKRKTSDWVGVIYTLREDGSVAQSFSSDRTTGQEITYNANSLVVSVRDNAARQLTEWFASGQFQRLQVWDSTRAQKGISPGQYRLITEFDSTGKLMVNQGNGYVVSQQTMPSERDANQQTTLTVEGRYVNGYQDGLWKGYTADGSYSFEERYELGKSLGGTAIRNGKTIAYDQATTNPEFKGGIRSLYSYLGQTIRYPIEAMRSRISGKVFVSFTVCTDGSLCDFDVIKGVHPSLDEEALRVVKQSSKRWEPGTQRGLPVRVKYNLPISFMME